MSNRHATCTGCGNLRWVSGGLCSTCRKRGTLAERSIPSHLVDLDLTRWVERAACGGDLLWFDRDVDQCRAVCEGCPVFAQCKADARRIRPAEGVWAGELWRDGRPVTRLVVAA